MERSIGPPQASFYAGSDIWNGDTLSLLPNWALKVQGTTSVRFALARETSIVFAFANGGHNIANGCLSKLLVEPCLCTLCEFPIVINEINRSFHSLISLHFIFQHTFLSTTFFH